MMSRLRLWIDCLLAALLPLYFLDDSLIPKSPYLAAMVAIVVIRFAIQRYNVDRLDAGIFFASILFVLSYSMALAYSTYYGPIAINAVYPIVFFFIVMSDPIEDVRPERVFLASAFAIIMIGWLRFVNGSGGLPSEHGLGYWGIKYDIATRNSDVLLALIVACAAIGAISAIVLDGRSMSDECKAGQSTSVFTPRFVVLLGTAAVALAAVLLSQSRGTWLAAILMIVLVFGKDFRAISRFAQFGLVLVLGVTAMLAIFPEMFEKFINVDNLAERFSSIYTGGGGASNGARWHLIKYALELTTRNPFFGVGIDHFNCCALRYGYVDILTTRHPENFYLHMSTGFGVLPAVAITYILIKSAWIGFKSPVRHAHLLGALLFSVLLYLQFNSEVPSLALWLMFGAIVARIARRDIFVS